MKKGIFTLLILILCGSVYAQTGMPDNTIFNLSIDNSLFNNNVRRLMDKAGHRVDSFEEIGGSDRFLLNNWGNGGAVTIKNQTVNTNKYRYNYDFFKYELYAKAGDTIIVVNDKLVRWFYIVDQYSRHTFGRFPAIGSTNFEELLSADTTATGKFKLIKQRNTSVIKYAGANGSTALSGATGDQYQNELVYFLVTPDGAAVKFKLNNKSFLACLPPAYQTRAGGLLQQYKKLDEQNLAMLINDLNSK